MVVVVDYGMGNLRSVSKALESLGASVTVSGDPAEVARAQKIVLPGVGAFAAAMHELSARRLVEPIKAAVAAGVPYLGICLGLQVLFEGSEEGPGVPGLGIVPGMVRRFGQTGSEGGARCLKVPHLGWNQIQATEAARGPSGCELLRGIPSGSFVYFVHSYYADPRDRAIIASETDYGVRFASLIWRDRLYATQFHPEKSQAVGLRLLRNFLLL
jgi:glutamine amidotransferase